MGSWFKLGQTYSVYSRGNTVNSPLQTQTKSKYISLSAIPAIVIMSALPFEVIHV